MKKYLYLLFIPFLLLAGVAQAYFVTSQGGTGTSIIPTYGQVLVGTAAGTYTPVATSTLGITSGASQTPWSANENAAGYTLNNLNVLNTNSLSATSTATSTIANFGGTLDCSAFAGADIYAKCNTAYAWAVTNQYKEVTLVIPNGKYSVSTEFHCDTNGFRCLLEGSPSGGTEIDWTGSATSTLINSGIQGTGIDHTSGCGIANLTIVGTSASRTSSPQIGVELGGVNGSDCTVMTNVNFKTLGFGLWTGANLYHFAWYNGGWKNVGENVHMDVANNSGEGMDFFNPFMIDAGNNDPLKCFNITDFAAAEVSVFGGSIDDCQVYVGDQVNFSTYGTNWENPDTNLSSYTYLVAGDSQYTNINIHNGMILNDRGFTIPTLFNVAGAHINFDGVTLFKSGGVVTNLVTSAGGKIDWRALNNTGGMVTNIYASVGFSTNGTNRTYQIPSLATAAGQYAAYDPSGNLIATTAPNVSGANLTGVVTSVGAATSFGTFTSSVLATALSDETGSGAAVFATSPFLTTPIVVTNARIPQIFGGAGTGSNLTLTSTSGVGTTGADIIFQTGNNGGTEDARILNNGNFGIGTTSPGSTLAVGNLGGINFYPTATSTFGSSANGINLINGCFSIAGTCVGGSGGGSGTVGSGTTGQFPYYAGAGMTLTATSTIFVSTASNVGIGTSSPTNLLQVEGNSNTQLISSMQNFNTSTAAVATQQMKNDVGAQLNLQMFGSGYNATSQNSYGSTIALAGFGRFRGSSAANGFIISTGGAKPLVFATNDTEVGRFDSAGNFGIGTSTAQTKLQVTSGASATTTVTVGELGLTSSHACVNMNRVDGTAASFYITAAGAMKVETNYCR